MWHCDCHWLERAPCSSSGATVCRDGTAPLPREAAVGSAFLRVAALALLARIASALGVCGRPRPNGQGTFGKKSTTNSHSHVCVETACLRARCLAFRAAHCAHSVALADIARIASRMEGGSTSNARESCVERVSISVGCRLSRARLAFV